MRRQITAAGAGWTRSRKCQRKKPIAAGLTQLDFAVPKDRAFRPVLVSDRAASGRHTRTRLTCASGRAGGGRLLPGQ